MIDNIDSVRSNWARLFCTSAIFLLALFVVAAAHAAVKQRTFATPEEAADALVHAVKARNKSDVVAIIGPGSEKWLWSGDENADRATSERFIAMYDQKHAISPDSPTRATLTLGPDEWPFAFPLVNAGTSWHFDTNAGKTELLARRIGQNELAVVNVMLAIVDAQREYASADRNRDGVREYARKFESSKDGKDGLYWQTAAGEPPSPLGPLVTHAAAEGYQLDAEKKAARTPYHGYYFRMMSGQGSHATGGALDYIVKGHMIGGFAAIAYPAEYGNTGVMAFIVNHDGLVYQKDFGPKTSKIGPAVTRFDPGAGWKPVDVK